MEQYFDADAITGVIFRVIWRRLIVIDIHTLLNIIPLKLGF